MQRATHWSVCIVHRQEIVIAGPTTIGTHRLTYAHSPMCTAIRARAHRTIHVDLLDRFTVMPLTSAVAKIHTLIRVAS